MGSYRHRVQSTATPPYSQYGRCSVDPRGQEDAGCVTAAVGGSAPHRVPYPGRIAPLAPRRLTSLCALQMVCFQMFDQVCPLLRVACYLRSQIQPQAQQPTHRPTRPSAQAPVVHAGLRDHCGWGPTNVLLCAAAGWPFSPSPLRCPHLFLETDLACSAKQALQGYTLVTYSPPTRTFTGLRWTLRPGTFACLLVVAKQPVFHMLG